jgi:tRNA pseudouridine13 synthase
MEAKVGITKFLTDGPSFSGEIKHLPSDFIVTELGVDGKPVVLVEETAPPPIPEQYGPDAADYTFDATNADVAATFDVEKLTEYLDDLNKGNVEAIFTMPCPEAKPDRGRIHALVRNHLPYLESNTNPAEGVIKLYCKAGVSSGRKHKKLGLDPRGKAKLPGKYVQFVLEKTDLDTMQALKILAQSVGTKDKFFGIAGNKDKRAVTMQMVSAFASIKENLVKKGPSLLERGIRVGSFVWTDVDLGLGDHTGNHFRIRVRGVPASLDVSGVVE